MKKSTLFLTTFFIMNAIACSSIQTQPADKNQTTQVKVLEHLENIETFPESSLGNQAVLFKEEISDICHIEFTGFHQKGKIIENWAFQGNKILAADSKKFMYVSENGTGQKKNKDDLRPQSIEKTPIDIQNKYKIQNFNTLKEQFKPSHLNECHK